MNDTTAARVARRLARRRESRSAAMIGVALAALATTSCGAATIDGAPATDTGTTAQVATSSSPAAAAPAPTPSATPVRHDPSLDAPLLQGAAANQAARVQELMARGADIEARGEHERTPLIEATKYNAVDAARVLIDAGADVNTKEYLHDSAYLYAGAEGLDVILDMTLSHGADLRSLNRYGGTALIPASQNGHVSTVRRLITAGVDVNHVNMPGWTALLEAIVYGDGSQRYQQVVTDLLDAGATRSSVTRPAAPPSTTRSASDRMPLWPPCARTDPRRNEKA